METTREIVVRFSFSRRQALFALAFFFIAWHPGFIGSESLTLTTYYPAPYGGYVSILTTGRTLLAREQTVGSNVGIGTQANVPDSKVDIRIPAAVGGLTNGVQITDDGANPDTKSYAPFGITRSAAAGNRSYIGMTKAGTFPWGVGIGNDNSLIMGEANANTGTISPTFALTTPVAGESNLYLGTTRPNPDRMLYVPKDVRIGSAGDSASGRLYGLCTTVGFGNGYSPCGTNERITAIYPDSTACETTGSLLRPGANMMDPGAWMPHTVDGCAGLMLCCRIVANAN